MKQSFSHNANESAVADWSRQQVARATDQRIVSENASRLSTIAGQKGMTITWILRCALSRLGWLK